MTHEPPVAAGVEPPGAVDAAGENPRARSTFLDQPIEAALGLDDLIPRAGQSRDDIGLRFYVEVLGLKDLHYGLWDGEPLTIEGLKQAQESYSDLLTSLIPGGVRTILDSGCGAGANAQRLIEKGYEVEGLSPDPFHGRRFVERTDRPFHLSSLQDFEPQSRFDLLYMSESAQYVPLEKLFPAARRVIRPCGYLLLSDYFARVKDGSHITKSGHLLEAFLAAAEAGGFAIEEQRDITLQVLPTLDLACELLDQYLLPAARLALRRAAGKSPRLLSLARWAMRRQLRKAESRKSNLDRREFEKKKCYHVYRFVGPG